ncbi:MAG TPA: c-type cytochrome [Terriglobales bacterium]
MQGKTLLWVFVCVLFLAVVVAVAQDQSQMAIKSAPMKQTSAASGAEMYKAYCASCHGAEGKGNGPAASALKVPPADLTQLSKNNGGQFPNMKVMSTIEGKSDVPAHGSREMPVWGQLFWDMSHGHEGEVQQRAMNLTKYIEGLQAK